MLALYHLFSGPLRAWAHRHGRGAGGGGRRDPVGDAAAPGAGRQPHFTEKPGHKGGRHGAAHHVGIAHSRSSFPRSAAPPTTSAASGPPTRFIPRSSSTGGAHRLSRLRADYRGGAPRHRRLPGQARLRHAGRIPRGLRRRPAQARGGDLPLPGRPEAVVRHPADGHQACRGPGRATGRQP